MLLLHLCFNFTISHLPSSDIKDVCFNFSVACGYYSRYSRFRSHDSTSGIRRRARDEPLLSLIIKHRPSRESSFVERQFKPLTIAAISGHVFLLSSLDFQMLACAVDLVPFADMRQEKQPSPPLRSPCATHWLARPSPTPRCRRITVSAS